VDDEETGVLKEANQVALRSFLQGKNGRGLKAKAGLEVLGNLTDKALKREPVDIQRDSTPIRWQHETKVDYLRRSNSVDFWYFLISRRATVPGR